MGKTLYSPLLRRAVDVSDEEYARRTAPKGEQRLQPPPSYELIVAERGADGEIRRMILRPLEEQEAATPAKAKP